MVKAIQQMHAPKDKTEVHSVLGVAELHDYFMKDNGALTQPLNDLLSKDAVFTWGEQHSIRFSLFLQIVN